MDKNMGAADEDKIDIISECVRQLGDIKTQVEISEEEAKQFVTEIQRNLKGLWKAKCIKAIVQKRG